MLFFKTIIFFIFFIFLIILLFLLFSIQKKYKESFENINNSNNINNINNSNKCNKFFKDNSFCAIDINKKKCSCRFQKDDIKINFSAPGVCCERNCNKIPLEECIENNNFTKIPYYCNIGGKCTEYEGTIINSHISANNCGTDPLSNQLLLPYDNIDDCKKSIKVCDKYNISNRSVHLNKADCIKDINCGYCTNGDGIGTCIDGTDEGPNDLQNYFYCNPTTKNDNSGINQYTYGDQAEYLLQSGKY
jgi:hypothetical protein